MPEQSSKADFWKSVAQASAQVKNWPKWKRVEVGRLFKVKKGGKDA